MPERSQQATLRSLTDDALRQVVQRYVTAWERNDVAAVAAMLAEDAKLTMPPCQPGTAAASRLPSSSVAGRWRGRRAGGGSPLARTVSSRSADTPGTATHRPSCRVPLTCLPLRGAQIQEITAFPGLGLPAASLTRIGHRVPVL